MDRLDWFSVITTVGIALFYGLFLVAIVSAIYFHEYSKERWGDATGTEITIAIGVLAYTIYDQSYYALLNLISVFYESIGLGEDFHRFFTNVSKCCGQFS